MTRGATRTLLFLLALSLALAGCGGGGGSASGGGSAAGGILPSPGAATIRGFVTDPRTGAPVDGALVTLQTAEGADPSASPATVRRAAAASPTAMTLTDARGYYEFANVAPARYAVSISKDGKLGATFVVRAVSGQIAEGSVELTPIITLAGRVTTPRPPAGSLPAVIWILGKSLGSLGEPAGETASGVTWRFEISGVPLTSGARYLLSYASEGAAAQTAEIVVVSAAQLTFRGAPVAVADFRAALPDVTLQAAPPTANQPPAADAGPDQSVAPGATVTLAGAGSDPEGRPVTFAWTQVSGPSATLSSSAVANPTFTAGSSGTYVFALVVSDGIALSAADYVSITVSATPNRPPVANAGPNQTVAPGAAVTLDGAASNDPDPGAALTFRWVQVAGPAVTLSGAQNAAATFTPTVPGDYTFALTVSDGSLTSSPAFVRVIVSGTANLPPIAAAAASASGTTATLSSTGSFDPEGNPLTFAWRQTAGPPVTLLPNAQAASPTFTIPAPGTYYFELVVSDGALSSKPAPVSLHVPAAANTPPAAHAGPDQSVTLAGSPLSATVTLDGSATTDPDGDAVASYRWTQITGPAVSLDLTTPATPSFTATLPGTYLFSLAVTDSRGASALDYVEVRVHAPGNATPLVTVTGPANPVTRGTPVTLSGIASDPDGPQPVAYTWRQTLGPAVSLAGADTAAAAFTPAEPGIYEFQLSASDGLAPGTAWIRVIVNRPPVADAGADKDGILVGSVVTLDGSKSNDHESSPLTYLWTIAGEPAGSSVTLSNPAAAAPVFIPAHLGRYTFRLVVNDGLEASAPAEVDVNVVAPVPAANLFVVTENAPGTPDAVAGNAGAIPGTPPANLRVVFSAVPQNPAAGDILGSAFLAADGSFAAVSIGDNDPRIKNDTLYAMVADPADRYGPAVRLVNDTTPPAAVELAPADPLPAVSALNAASYGITGRAEPGASVELVMSLDPAHRLAPPAVAASASTGVFTATFDLSNPALTPDGETYSLFARAIDAAGNAGPFTLLAGNLVKDTVAPVVTGFQPEPNVKIGLQNIPIRYTLSEPVEKGEIVFTCVGGSADPNSPHTIIPPSAALGRGTHTFDVFPAPPLVHDAIYDATFQVFDRAGNASTPITVTNLVADGIPPASVAVLAPSTGGVVSADRPRINYEIGSGETVARLLVRAESPADPRSPLVWETTDNALLMSDLHLNVPIGFPVAPNAETVYSFVFEFHDEVGNVTTITHPNVKAVAATGSIVVEKPKPGGTLCGTNPIVSYLLTETLQSLRVEVGKSGGSGITPPSQSATLEMDQLYAGSHPDVALLSLTLAEGDTVTLRFIGQTLSGAMVGPVEIPEVTIDATPPALVSATAIQKVFDRWNPGDRITLVFSEPMDTVWGMPGPGEALNLLLERPVTHSQDGFIGFTAMFWSSDKTAVTFTFDDPDTLPDSTLSITPFQLTARDAAGNLLQFPPYDANNSATYFTFTQTGDVTPPALKIFKPGADSYIGAGPLVEYATGEPLADAELRFDRVVGSDPLPRRIFNLSGADLLPPASPDDRRVIDLGARGFSLPDGNVYTLTFSGRDGAGNSSEVQVKHLTVDTIPPGATAAVTMFGFHNFSGNLVSVAADNGTTGEYICLRLGPPGQPVYTSVLPSPYAAGQVVISGVAGAPYAPGTEVWLAWQDQAGNRTAFVQDGVIPAPPLAADLNNLFVTYNSTQYGIYSLGPLSLADGWKVWVGFDTNPALAWSAGNVMSAGMLTPQSDAIPFAAVQAGRAVYYMAENGDQNVSGYSAQDGTIAGLADAVAVSGGTPGSLTGVDTLRLSFTHPVSRVNTLTESEFVLGQTTSGAAPYWSANPQYTFNLSAWNAGGAPTSIATFSLSLSGFTNQTTVDIPLSTVTVSGGPADRLSVAVPGLGTETFLSPGGHCVLPKAGVAPITPDGNEPGVVAGDDTPPGDTF